MASKTEKVKAPKELKKTSKKTPKTPPKNPFVKVLFSIGGYFKGAWTELRLVRWPTRQATWGLTIAVILFSVFFAVIILLLDILFKYLFSLLIK